MKFKCVGKEKVDYVSKSSGRQVTGCNFHYTEPANPSRGSGLITGRLFISQACGVDYEHIIVGSDYNVSFNRYGSVESIEIIK